MNKLKLFCIPYGGSSAAVYLKWKKLLRYPVDLCPVELAGRGKESSTPFYHDIEDAVRDIYQSVKGELDTGPYAIFGHSMGCALAHELVYKILELNHQAPVHLFLSGRYPPHIQKKRRGLHNLPDSDFMQEVLKYGGMPEEFLAHRELMDVFLPILRADFKMIEEYTYVPKPDMLHIDITAFGGAEDFYTTEEDLSQWRDYTDKDFKLHMFKSGHFFINDHMEEVLSIINSTLMKYV